MPSGDFSSKKNEGLLLLEILLVLVFCSLLAFLAVKTLRPSRTIDTQTKQTLSAEGIDTSSSAALEASVRRKIDAVQEAHLEALANVSLDSFSQTNAGEGE